MVIMQQPPEITVAYLFTEHLAKGPRLMEMILERGNMFKALARVRGNKGAPGVDKMTVDQLPGYLKHHWPKIREDLLNGSYKPSPVRRKEIPKPGGGVRLLGIPHSSGSSDPAGNSPGFSGDMGPHLFEFKFWIQAGKIPA